MSSAKPQVVPLIDVAPEAQWTDGDDAAALAAEFGIELDDWQIYALRRSLGRTAKGWASGEVGVEISRQNGKTVILQVRALWGMWGAEERLITWTAHEYKTAREAYRDLKYLISNSPYASEVTFRTFPQLEIEHRSGRRIVFLARTGGSGRGFTGDCVILDEAYELTADEISALMPTLSARPDPQIWYASMAGMEKSEHLASVRERALSPQSVERLCYLAWAAALDGKDVDLDDRDGWQRANPALPHRISWDFIELERGAMTDEAFARERLGIWSGVSLGIVLDPDTWAGQADTQSVSLDPVSFGVEVSFDRTAAWIYVAGARPDSHKHTELVPCCTFHAEQGGRCAGTAWVPARLAKLDKKWKPAGIYLDPSGPAGSLIVPLTKAGVEPDLIGAREMAQACGELYDAVMAEDPEERTLHHLGDDPYLNAAVAGARKRPLADAWAWQPVDGSVDIAPLRAATLAVHGVDKPSKRKRKTGRVLAV